MSSRGKVGMTSVAAGSRIDGSEISAPNGRRPDGKEASLEAFRQGDVLIVPIEESGLQPFLFNQDRGTPLYRERNEGLVLAEGEATGHAHRVRSIRARMRRHAIYTRGQRTTYTCLSVPPEGAVVEHEEHAPIALTHGKYLVVRQSEYTPASEEAARESARRASSRTYVAD